MGKGRNGSRSRKIKRNHPSIKISNNIKKHNLNNNIKHNLTLNELLIIMHYINNKSKKLRNLTEEDLI
tara:strand:- start:71 stop:274 length:204 start_codon:yes stop_codon:yes gene_type:complete